MDKPSYELCYEWRQHPCTKWLLDEIEDTIEQAAEQAIKEAVNSESEFQALRQVLKLGGSVQSLESVFITVDQIASEEV